MYIGRAIVVTGAVLALLAGAQVGASSAGDTTAPVLRTPAKGAFVTNAQIPLGMPPDCGDDPHDLRMTVPLTFKWTGSDDSGTVRYSLVQNTGYNGREDVFVDSSQTSYTGSATNTDQFCGGGNHSVYEWNLTGTDPSGNSTTNNIYGGRMRLTQDSNLTDGAGYATQPVIAYQGKWGLSYCACWSDGAVHRTSTRGASVTITPQYAAPFPHYSTAHHVALVMHRGPDRGRFRISVDGVVRTTVDLYAANARPRVIVWRAAFAEYGHTIKLENLGTAGRPRIDLDAVLTN